MKLMRFLSRRAPPPPSGARHRPFEIARCDLLTLLISVLVWRCCGPGGLRLCLPARLRPIRDSSRAGRMSRMAAPRIESQAGGCAAGAPQPPPRNRPEREVTISL